MQTVQGDILAGEAQGVMSAVAARQRGSILIYWGAIIALALLGAGIGYGCALILRGTKVAPGLDPGWMSVLGMYGGWFAYTRLCRPLIVARFRRGLEDRGLGVSFPYEFSFSEMGVRLTCGGLVKTADWATVTEVFKVRRHWVFLVQMEPWVAPARFFSSIEAEKQFVGVALTQMTPAAVSRSKSAAKFVEA